MTSFLFWSIVLLAFAFGMTNGFIVGGSLVSAIITTRSLGPMAALAWVAAGELLGVFLLGQEVVRTLGRHLVIFPVGAPPIQYLAVLIAALIGALGWNLVMWKMALPTSSGHALLGGLVGAFVGAYGWSHIHWDVFIRMFALLGLVPLAGAFLGYGLSRFSYWIGEFMTPSWGPVFRGLQITSLAGSALAHGSNDGQKTMVMIGLAMAGAGMNGVQRSLPWPVTLLCGLALMTGLILGSKRIVQKLGQKLYRVQPLQGVCAQTATALLVGVSSIVGYPMSSSQLISTSLMGAGVAVNPRSVRWELVSDIWLAWLITLPTAAVVSGVLGGLVRLAYVVP